MTTDCLASTGVTSLPLLLLLGVTLLTVGIVVLLAFRKRSALLLLALLPLAIGGLVVTQAPAPSFAACATTTSSTPTATATPEPTATPALVVVTTVAPSAAPTCYSQTLPSTIALPEAEGITYAAAISGATVTVTATANPGFTLDPAAVTTWIFEAARCPSPEG